MDTERRLPIVFKLSVFKNIYYTQMSKSSDLEKELREKLAQAQNDLKNNGPTIVVLGETGAGKSSLINAVFGAKVARVGHGKPITKEFEYHRATDDCPVNIYDSKGFELGDKQITQNIKKFLRDRTNYATLEVDMSKQIHVVWYCFVFFFFSHSFFFSLFCFFFTNWLQVHSPRGEV